MVRGQTFPFFIKIRTSIRSLSFEGNEPGKYKYATVSTGTCICTTARLHEESRVSDGQVLLCLQSSKNRSRRKRCSS